MKTLKPILIAVFAAFTMMSLGNAVEFHSKTSKKCINMNYEQTMNDAGLTQIMHLQLDPGFLDTFKLVYTVDVAYRGYTVRVSGTRNQWILFFSPQGTGLSRHKYTENQR